MAPWCGLQVALDSASPRLHTADVSSTVDRFLQAAALASRQAGHVARHLQGRVENLGKSAHGTPESEALTAVDLACQEVFLEVMRQELPQAAIDAEEDTALASSAPAEAPGRPLVVLDPVDGTLSYLTGSDDWAVMSGLIEDGRYSAVHLEFPGLDWTIWAAAGRGAWVRRGSEDERRVAIDAHGAGLPRRVLCGAWFPKPGSDALEALGLEVVRSRCSAVDATAPLLGRGCGAVTRYRVDRRHAIGLVASLEAGAHVRVGDRAWTGEDPATLPDDGRPSVLAVDARDAEAWQAALSDAL